MTGNLGLYTRSLFKVSERDKELFEIYLLKTKLSFYCPKGNAPLKADLHGYTHIDERPYINPLSAIDYSPDPEDGDPLYFSQTFLRRACHLRPVGWLRKPAAELVFSASALTRNLRDCPPQHLMVPENTKAWVINQCRESASTLAKVEITEIDGMYQIDFDDTDDDVTPVIDPHVSVIDVGGRPIYAHNPSPDRLVFYIAASEDTMISFNFLIKLVRQASEAEKAAIIRSASMEANAIINSIRLDINHRNPMGISTYNY